MKRIGFMLLTILLAILSVSVALAQEQPESFTQLQHSVFEAVKWNVDLPKNAHVEHAMEYLCKVEDHQLRLLLIKTTQNEHIATLFGSSSGILLVDLDSGCTITYANCVWPESSTISSREEALNMIFSCYDSYLLGYNPFVYADFEMTYPLSAEEINEVNAQLDSWFLK